MHIFRLVSNVTLLTDVIKPVVGYLGPGAGLSAIGAFLAAIFGIVIAIIGFIWYPIRRILRKFRKRREPHGDNDE